MCAFPAGSAAATGACYETPCAAGAADATRSSSQPPDSLEKGIIPQTRTKFPALVTLRLPSPPLAAGYVLFHAADARVLGMRFGRSLLRLLLVPVVSAEL